MAAILFTNQHVRMNITTSFHPKEKAKGYFPYQDGAIVCYIFKPGALACHTHLVS